LSANAKKLFESIWPVSASLEGNHRRPSRSPSFRSSRIQRDENRQPCEIGIGIQHASGLPGKPYKLIQYGFDPFILDRCRDRRRNSASPTSYLVLRVDRYRDCQRRLFHRKRTRRTIEDCRSDGALLSSCYLTGRLLHQEWRDKFSGPLIFG
jgi:hypothetical protein